MEENFRGSYDVLVRPAGSTSAFEQSEGLVRQAFTSSTYGGISFDQLAAIRAIPGVEVAAPLATVGYVMMNATTTVDVSSALSGTDRRLGFYTITAISRNGHVRKTSVEGYVFTTAHWGQRENASGPLDIEGDTIRRACTETAVTFEVGVIWEPRCGPMAGSMADEFGVVTQVDPTVNHEVVDVRLAYPLLITAIDPAAENALTGLDAAVLEGRALTAEDAARSGPDNWDWPRVPALLAAQQPADFTFEVAAKGVSPALVDPFLAETTDGPRRALVVDAPATGSFTTTVAASELYERMIAGRPLGPLAASGDMDQLPSESLVRASDTTMIVTDGVLHPQTRELDPRIWARGSSGFDRFPCPSSTSPRRGRPRASPSPSWRRST